MLLCYVCVHTYKHINAHTLAVLEFEPQGFVLARQMLLSHASSLCQALYKMLCINYLIFMVRWKYYHPVL
jgi:hypothetical protein